MKKILLALLVSSAATASTPSLLMRFSSGGGFAPVPRLNEVLIYSDGNVISRTTTGRSANDLKKTEETLAVLSQKSVKNLMAKMDQVPSSVKVVDPDKNKPRCMDAPSKQIVIKKSGKDVVIYQWEGCHTAHADNSMAQDLEEIMLGLVNLSY